MASLVVTMAVALAFTPQQPVPSTPIVFSYSETVTCAGVTQAASELEGTETERGRRLFDAALYWSLTTIQIGKASGRPDVRTERDMTTARIRAVRDLSRQHAETLTLLEKCIKSAPSLG